jgi:hypothetical protein
MSYLSRNILDAARSIPYQQREGSKAWIDQVFFALCDRFQLRLSLDRFKAELVKDVDCRMLLATADMTHCYPADRIAASHVAYRLPAVNGHGTHVAAIYNFVRLPS